MVSRRAPLSVPIHNRHLRLTQPLLLPCEHAKEVRWTSEKLPESSPMPPVHRSPPAPSPRHRCRLVSVSSDAKSCPSPFQYRVASLILPLCTGASPGPPQTTTPPSLARTPPCAGEIRLPCHRFVMLHRRRVRHARQVHRIFVNLFVEVCPGVSHHRLAVGRAKAARHACTDGTERVALEPRPWIGPVAARLRGQIVGQAAAGRSAVEPAQHTAISAHG
jgi:hypothetical protein